MMGRILSYLKARGVLKEAPRNGISTRKRLWRRPYAIRKPRGYPVMEPGDLVQVDTLDVRPLPGVILKHFTARDVVSRWDVVEVRTRATANTATDFLRTLQARMPFPVRAIQVDGGSEFQAGFEQACQSEVFASSYCHLALPSSMVPWSGHNVPIPRNSMRSMTFPWRSLP